MFCTIISSIPKAGAVLVPWPLGITPSITILFFHTPDHFRFFMVTHSPSLLDKDSAGPGVSWLEPFSSSCYTLCTFAKCDLIAKHFVDGVGIEHELPSAHLILFSPFLQPSIAFKSLNKPTVITREICCALCSGCLRTSKTICCHSTFHLVTP